MDSEELGPGRRSLLMKASVEKAAVAILDSKLRQLTDSQCIPGRNLVKQHAKSLLKKLFLSWEKGRSQKLACNLKNHLESVTLFKLTAEEPKLSHLDWCLKECIASR
nr:filament-like plant protein 4 [Ipomoea batatas]